MGQNKILVMDDNPKNIQILGSVLKETNYEVGFATNGKQALELLNFSNDYDLVLLDIDMPVLEGYQTCRIMRSTENLKEIPVIFLTSSTEQENIVKGFDAGAQDYVVKPFNSRELLRRVDTQIQLKIKSDALKSINQLLENKVEERTQELKIALAHSEEMNKVKSIFFANMSHELRTPFVGIMGYAELLRESLTNPDDKEMVIGILESSHRMTDTLSKILSLSKLELDNIFEEKENDVNAMLMSLCDELKGAAIQKNISLRTEINMKESRIIINEDLFNDVFRNLISNAIIYTYEGGVSITAFEEIKENNEMLIIRVADTGIGIPEDKKEIIFQPFRQVSEGNARRFQGTGLGLAIAKKSVELLGGIIHLESDKEKGSVFTVEIPFRKNESHQNVIEVKVPPVDNKIAAVKDEVKLKRERILHVEDNLITIDIFRRVLSLNYEYDSAVDPDSALSYVENNKYDAILMDINLGKETGGEELTKIIRKIPGYENTPIIAVTAYASKEDKSHFLSKGMSHFIAKPFAINKLLELLELVFAEKVKEGEVLRTD